MPPLNIFGLGRVRVPILFGNYLPRSYLPYTKGFMKFGCPEPSKKVFDFRNFCSSKRRLTRFVRVPPYEILVFPTNFIFFQGNEITLRGKKCTALSPLSQRQTSYGMTKPILYHKTHTAWQKSYCMSFAMPSYFPWIHGKTHVINAPPYPWLFPCSNLSLVSQLFAFDSTF